MGTITNHAIDRANRGMSLQRACMQHGLVIESALRGGGRHGGHHLVAFLAPTLDLTRLQRCGARLLTAAPHSAALLLTTVFQDTPSRPLNQLGPRLSGARLLPLAKIGLRSTP